jgi:integrase
MQSQLFSIDFEAIKPPLKPFDLRIGNGLILHISLTNYRVYQFKYRYLGKRKTMTFGPFDLLSLDDVNRLHKDARRSLLNGKCPMNERKIQLDKANAERLTINDLAALYINEHVVTLKRPEQPIYMIERFILPLVGKIQASDLQMKDVHRATNKAAPTVARKVVERLYAIYDFAIGKGIINIVNPLTNKVKNFGVRAGKTTRTLSFDEIQVFVSQLPVSGLHPSFVTVSLLLLATGQRKSEILNAQWKDIDFDNRKLVITQDRLKTAKSDTDKKSNDHVIHLSDFALSLLKSQLNRTQGKKLVFFDVSPLSYNKALTVALLAIGLRHFTPHDLRRTFVSRNVEKNTELGAVNKVDEFVLEKILNHKMKGIMAHYNLAEYMEERKEALDAWGGFLAKQPM